MNGLDSKDEIHPLDYSLRDPEKSLGAHLSSHLISFLQRTRIRAGGAR